MKKTLTKTARRGPQFNIGNFPAKTRKDVEIWAKKSNRSVGDEATTLIQEMIAIKKLLVGRGD